MAFTGKLALFIDGSSLYYSASALGFEVDFRRLLAEFSSRDSFLRAYYYTTIEDSNDQSLRPLVDWLDYNGYCVTAKSEKDFDDGMGRRKIKRNISIELAVGAMELVEQLDRMVLFSGDGDFRALVEAMQRRGVHVTVVSTMRTKPAMISSELRRQADQFVELEDLKASICRAARGAIAKST